MKTIVFLFCKLNKNVYFCLNKLKLILTTQKTKDMKNLSKTIKKIDDAIALTKWENDNRFLGMNTLGIESLNPCIQKYAEELRYILPVLEELGFIEEGEHSQTYTQLVKDGKTSIKIGYNAEYRHPHILMVSKGIEVCIDINIYLDLKNLREVLTALM